MQIFRIKHKPTNLFYCSRKGRFKSDLTNLSEKGEFYTNKKTAEKVLNEDCKRALINDAQKNRFNIDNLLVDEFEIIEYVLQEKDS